MFTQTAHPNPVPAPGSAAEQPRQRMLRLHEQLASLDLVPASRLAQRNCYRLEQDGQPLVALTHPDYARLVFQRANIYPKAIAPGQMSYDDEAERLSQLRFLRPHFHRQQMAGIFDLMVTTIDQQLDDWANSPHDALDLSHAMSKVTLAVLTRATFGDALNHQEFEKLDETILYLMENSPGEESAQLLRATPALQPALAIYDQLYARAVMRIQQANAVCEKPGEGQAEDQSGACQSSLLGMLLDAVDGESGEPFNQHVLREELLFIFSVGFENIATGLTWSIHCLTQHPEKLAIAQNEMIAAIGDGLPTLESLRQLNYAGMVLQEALRLHLPMRWLQRRAIADDWIDGHFIPAGALVLLAAGLFHFDPELWPNPAVFEPERFSPENFAKQHPCAWLPFGKGQRFCLGKDFAMMEGKLILAMVLQRFNFDLASEQ